MLHRERLMLPAMLTALWGALLWASICSVGVAEADVVVGSPGAGAGQVQEPRGIAVDPAEDRLYVADMGNNRVDVFEASSGEFVRAFGWGVADGASALQTCTTICLMGLSGSGAGQFGVDSLRSIAVDVASHSVYALDKANFRVQKFSSEGAFLYSIGGAKGSSEGQFEAIGGITVGPASILYVADQVGEGETGKTRVQKYNNSGSYLGQLLLSVEGGAGNTTGIAVDSLGNLYLATEGATGAVRKYDSAGNLLQTLNPSFNINSIAIDGVDHLFVNDNSTVSTILEYDSSGTQVSAFYGTLKNRALGLAAYSSASGDIFAIEEGRFDPLGAGIVYIPFSPPGPIVYPDPTSVFADQVGAVKATLHSRINPEGKPTTYYFEYVDDQAFQAEGFSSSEVVKTETTSIGADFQLQPAAAAITGLTPETTYHFRAVATNADAPGGRPGPEATFQTAPPVRFEELWVSEVGTDTALLSVTINPFGSPATGRFQYVEETDYQQSGFAEGKESPLDPIDFGSGEGSVTGNAFVPSLSSGTTYRFRLVVASRCRPTEPEVVCTFEGPTGSFSTFGLPSPPTDCSNDHLRAAGSGTLLPDCRGYEMVSPVDKNGSFIEPVFSISGFVAGIDRASASGDSVTYSAYKAFGDVESAPYTNQYLSRRSSSGWQTEGISPQREGPSLMTYLSAQLDRQYRAFSDDLCNGWVLQDANPVLAPEGISDFPGLYRRDNCGPEVGSYEALTTVKPPNLAPRKFIPDLQGTNGDGSVAIFTVNDNLTSGLPNQPLACQTESSPSSEPCESRLYEAREGQLKYVCILPGGTPYSDACSAGTGGGLGAAGRAGNFSNAISADGSHIFWTASESGPGSLYVRINGTESIEISKPSARFWAAAADGSKVIYTVGEELYVFDVGTETATLIADAVSGLAGASEDASRLYFASTEVLTGEEENSEGGQAAAGQPNLYFWETGNFQFIATLPVADVTEAGPSPVSRHPFYRISRVTPAGQRLLFMSTGELTGYDNTDVASGEADAEVFLYDAPSGELLCPSCNPTNARPVGAESPLIAIRDLWVSAWIPTFESQLYGSRVLTDDGNRLYFNSFDALSPLDTNGQEDVYQWSAPGTGSCTTASPTHHATSGGCVDLISSGRSPEGSELVDISTDGADVFFKTTESLVNQDPGLRDIYDARVEGGFPPLPPRPIIGEGEDVLPDPKPAPPVSSPSSQAAGPGNPKPPKPKKCRKGTHKVKAKGGKVRCVKNRKAKKGGKAGRRANNNRRAGK
jgi:hypothetical protein